MGVRKISYYTVECNVCKSGVEDYAGELTEPSRKAAEQIAKSFDFVQIGKNTWLCPACAKAN